jgi:hypothetical protein
MPIEKLIEAIFAGQDIGAGDVDVDGVLAAFEELTSIATQADLPVLIAALRSPRNNFWTRELFSEPICHLGGADYLESLLEAAQLNLDERHDNDGFHTHLIEMARKEPDKCRAKLEQLLARKDFRYPDYARWLLPACRLDKPNGTA